MDDTYQGPDLILSAEYNLDKGEWLEWDNMEASDGVFDEVIEDVEAGFFANIIGPHEGCVRGTDEYYNLGDASCQTFLIDYDFEGFFDPIDISVTNEAKAGRAIPIKWRLTDANGEPIDNPSSFSGLYSQETMCDNETIEDPVLEYSAGDSGLQYLGDGYWQYNWKTPKTYAGKCLVLYVEFDSTSASPVALFKFK